MVSLGAEIYSKDWKEGARSVVQVTVDEKTYALCVLTAGKVDCFSLDINFAGEVECSFSVLGPNPVRSVVSTNCKPTFCRIPTDSGGFSLMSCPIGSPHWKYWLPHE
uniref:Nucleoplasmin-like domain-containing protein n=1 Tax=Rhodosorus marinus TaxID=101924 RepID=A0A7S2ZW68_9RHOD|mmetsp:Transcript_31565/g.122249  ORF Transcript_31565/g.122249 Transcript_31565/m.122249 type:complete len:107 (+) Transcript_31565:207-527(+)